MVIELAYFACDFADLPPFEAVFRVENVSILLLKFPQLRIRIERAAEIRLPLTVSLTALRQIFESIKQLFALVEQIDKLVDDFLLGVDYTLGSAVAYRIDRVQLGTAR